MAIWQFDVELVPNEWAREHLTNVSDCLDHYCCAGAWQEPIHKEAAERVIDKYLDRREVYTRYSHDWGFVRWGDRHGSIVWGDDEKHDVKLEFTNDNIGGIFARIDLTGGYARAKFSLKSNVKDITITPEEQKRDVEEMFYITISISRELGLLIVAVEEAEILHPSIEAMMSCARRSRTVERMRSFPTDVTQQRKAEQRLISELLRLAEGRETGDTAVIEPLPTQQELATLLFLQREAIGRDMSKLKDAGLIDRKGRRLTIRSLAKLRALLETD